MVSTLVLVTRDPATDSCKEETLFIPSKEEEVDEEAEEEDEPGLSSEAFSAAVNQQRAKYGEKDRQREAQKQTPMNQ